MQIVGYLLLSALAAWPQMAQMSHVARRAVTSAEILRALAEGCTTTTLSCGVTATGHLGIGDCTFSDGTYFDAYTFQGAAGQVVTIDMRPLSSTLTSPLIVLAPPPNDASKTPVIYGGTAGTEVSYVLSSTGTWTIGIGTNDLFASGGYLIRLQCFVDDAPDLPQNCIDQWLVCGQTAGWYLTAQSCRFENEQRAYQAFDFYAVAGDAFNFDELSSDFEPVFGVYDSAGNLLRSSTFAGSDASHATMLWVAPQTGFYFVAATSTADLSAGFFSMSVTCSRSGCTEPIFVSQPPATTRVPYGAPAAISTSVNGFPTPQITWEMIFPDEGLTLGTGPTLFLPSVTSPISTTAVASNACGNATSTEATVSASPPPHPRIVRH